MNRTGNDLRAATRWSAGKTALWVFAAHVAVLGLCIGGIYTQPDTVPAGQCEGIGWGCTTSPRAEAFLALIFF